MKKILIQIGIVAIGLCAAYGITFIFELLENDIYTFWGILRIALQIWIIVGIVLASTIMAFNYKEE